MASGKTVKSSNTITNSASELKWLGDLNELLRESKSRFADVIWSTTEGELIYGNKCIIYARAAGSFQLKYLNNSHHHQQQQNQHNNSQDPRRNSSSRSLPFQPYNHSNRSLSSSHDFHENALFLRTPSPSTSISSSASTINGGPMNSIIPIPLEGTDPATFAGCLEFLYTGAKAAEVFAVLFDGFEEGLRDENDNEISSVVRLRQDLLYAWRSKLFADVSLALDDGSRTVFASHRAILASRSPYFQSLLLGNYGDSNRTEFVLPSPPFTPASTVFCLGYIYSGTLDFGDRSFDLNTAFDLWRCGTYLSMEDLQLQTEEKILEMLNLKRSARIYQFALSPDVNSTRLSRLTEPYLIGHFGEVWSCSQIGNLDFSSQRKLVADVCKTIIPSTVTSIGKSAFSLRKKLELERAPWAGHILSMVEAIEDRLRDVMSRNLSEIVVSTGFVDLIDGVGFSTDVLEWLLELAVGGLTEGKAPEAYQALVGSVLLREEGITMDAKVLVEDAKNGILKYIKRKCVGIRSARGFENLEPWCLKEIADEIEVSLEDLQAISNRPPVSTSRTGLRITPKRSNGTFISENNASTPSTLRSPVILSTARTSSTVTPRTTATRPVNRPAATTTPSTSTSTTTNTSAAMLPPASTVRASRPMTVSATSRQSAAATAAASVIRSRSNGRTATSMSRTPSNATSTSSTGESTTSSSTPIRSPRPIPPALPITNISTPPVASTSRYTGARTPTSSVTKRPTSLAVPTVTPRSTASIARPPNPPFNTSNRTNVPAPTTNRIVPKPRTPTNPSVPFPSTRASTSSTVSTSSPVVTSASVKGKERAKISSISSTTSATPSITSGRPASIASTRTINGTRFKSNEISVRPPPSSTATTSSSTTITAAKVGRSNSITSTKSTRSTSTLGGRIAPRPTPIVKAPPLPTTSTSTTTSNSTIPAVKTNLEVPPTPLSPKSHMTPSQMEEIISVSPVSLPQIVPTLAPASFSITIPAPMSAPLAISTTLTNRDMNLMPPKEPNSELRRTFSTKTLPPPSPTRISPNRPSPLTSIPPSFSSRHSQPLASPPLVPFSTLHSPKSAALVSSTPTKILPGTTLLSGIPCIVTVDVDKHTARFRAAVRYLGGVLWKGGEVGQWVGVEVVESSIPDECLGLNWNDGEVEGVLYFKVTPESNRSKNASRAASAAGNYSEVPSPSLEGSTSSLRPPSRRPRRSSSTDGGSLGGQHQDGPRRGLFVRPNQIVYVL